MSIGEIIYCLLLIATTTFLVFKTRFFKLQGIKSWWLAAAFYLKVMAGLLMTVIYTRYYPDRNKADIFKYFDDSEVMYQSIHSSPMDYVKMVLGIQNDNASFDSLYYSKMNNWYRKYETVTYNDSHTIIRINALLRPITFGYFQVHNLFFIILSFIGLVALYRTFCQYFTSKPFWLFAAVFLVPSVVFWSSGALKESVLFFAIGIFMYAFQQLIFISVNIQRILLAILGIVLLVFIKMYVLAVLIPIIAANVWIVFTNNRKVLIKFLISILFFINAAILVGKIFPEYNVFELLVGKQHDFIGLARFENAGSFIDPLPLEPHFASFLENAPMAIVNALLRPFPNEISSVLMIPALIENILLVIFLLLAIVFHQTKINHWRIIFLSLFFALLLSIILGLTTPVLGALVRYRIPAIPFLFIALFSMIDFQKIGSFIGFKPKVKS